MSGTFDISADTKDTKEKRESTVIARTDLAFGSPVTRDMLIADFRSLGLCRGDVVLVHSSLSSLGWVVGESRTVIEALQNVIGETGTLVMPAHSGHLSDPELWEHPPVPESWKQIIRDEMPAFDPGVTATRGMGAIPELFRTLPGVLRSYHPTASFAASGQKAAFITENHSLETGLGDSGPLGRVHDLNGKVLLIGVRHGNNTSLHLAEHRADWPTKTNHREGSPVYRDGERAWMLYDELDFEDEDFEACGAAFEESVVPNANLSVAKVALAECRLMNQRALVNFATEWLSKNRATAGNV